MIRTILQEYGRSRRERPSASRRLRIEPLEIRRVLSVSFGEAPPLQCDGPVAGEIRGNAPDDNIVTDTEGNWVAVWQSISAGEGHRRQPQLLVSNSSDEGATWSEPAVVGDATADCRSPSIVQDTVGSLVVGWQTVDLDASEVQPPSIQIARSPDDVASDRVRLTDGELRVKGTMGDDRIVVRQDDAETVSVRLGGGREPLTYPAELIDRIVIEARGGDDRVIMHRRMDIPATVRGGSGDDVIRGGAAADLLLGQGGDDVIFGRKSRDMILGQGGSDRLKGGGGQDILIDGRTTHDRSDEALLNILDEWNSSGSNRQRQDAIEGLYLDSTTLRDNRNIDTFTRVSRKDWVLKHQGDQVDA